MDILDYSIAAASKAGVKMPFLDTDTGEPVTFQGPKDKEPREFHLVLLGPEAGETTRVFKQLQHRASKRDPKHSPSDAEIEADRIADSKAIARLVVGGLLYSKGAWIEMNSENAGDFLYQVGPLRAQAVDFVLKAGNFTAKSKAA